MSGGAQGSPLPPSTSQAASLPLRASAPIAYLMPEFPGQTHIWFWREVSHMRDWGVDARLFSTRPPEKESAAQHAFASQATAETTYLWPRPIASVLAALAWGLKRPRRFVRAAAVPLALDDVSLRERAATFPLVVAACVFARETTSRGIPHVHLHSAARSAVIALMARRLSGLTYSLTLHGNLDWWGGGMRLKLENAEFTIVVADWLRDDVHRQYPGVRASTVSVSSMGVDTEAWVPAASRSHGATFRLITVGRLHHAKGHDVALRALARLRGKGRAVHLSIIGSGPEKQALESLVEQLRLEDSVEFVGTLPEDEVVKRLQQADAFVLASRDEPRAVAYMESMALALPTIGTEAGGSAEIITNEHDGLLVPPEDEERLAVAIARVIDDPDLRTRLSRNARETAVERFDSRIGAAVLYERLFGTAPPSSPRSVRVPASARPR
jgi:colanic acid/amylovoran biosynthesis glycosyltransferase